MTLIPVNNTSVDTDKSSNLGASLWIDIPLAPSFGKAFNPSIGSPFTLNKRP